MKYGTALLWICGLLAIGLANPALAVDGVVEINQSCAVNTGCFSGDSAGLPVTITGAAGRSYRLTTDLTVADENTDGIQVSANDVSIDLNGFAISGPVTCSGNPLTCSHASGTGSGVKRTLSLIRGISVKNGSITGMGNHGVHLGYQAEVRNLRVRWNRVDGISAYTASTVSGNIAHQNGDGGIYVQTGSTVSGNTAYNNGGDGIAAFSGSTVSGNTVYDNDGDGITAVNGTTISGNTVRYNTGYGLNFGIGLSSAYSENVISTNTAGTVSGSGVELGQNVCNGNTTCP